MASIEAVFARQILDSRGNPTLEAEVLLDDGTHGPGGRPQRGLHRRVRGGRTAATGTAIRRQGGRPRRSRRVIEEIQPALLGYDADDQRLIDQAMIDLDRTPDKSRLGANAILAVSLAVAKAAAASRGPAPVPLPGWPQRPRAAGADDEHPQRRCARRQQRRHPGVHDRPGRRRHLRGGGALGRGDLPRAEIRDQAARAVHRGRRRGRVRARPRPQPGGARPHRRGDRQGRAPPRPRYRAGHRFRGQQFCATDPTCSRARPAPPTR